MEDRRVSVNVSSGGGITGIVAIAAAIFSYSMYKSIGWAIVHAIFNWITFIYWIVDGNPQFFEKINWIISRFTGG
jgi:hypothetical protein